MTTHSVPLSLKQLKNEFDQSAGGISGASDEFLRELVRFRYPDKGREPTIAEIKEALDFGYPMQVTRLLQLAKERGLFKIQINAPAVSDYLLELRRCYPKLKRVEWVDSNDDNRLVRRALGQKMAQVFDSIWREKGSVAVTIGGGKTMQNFISNLGMQSRSIVVSPMALFTRSEIGDVYDSAFLAMVLHWNSGETSSAYVCALPPLPERQREDSVIDETGLVNYCHKLYNENNKVREVFTRSAHPDVAIFGVADIHEKSSIVAGVYRRLGYDSRKLKELGAVADLNYTVLRENGEDLSEEISKGLLMAENAPEYSHPFLLAVNTRRLSELSEDKSKDVFVVAGSSYKFRSIRAVLRGGLANSLVTDKETIERLIKEP
jgi:DNA-binding transcriptional regulator LsrR (DeoR family)